MTDPDVREVRLFRNNCNQAVSISVDRELLGDRALLCRDGERLILEPVRKPGLLGLLALWDHSMRRSLISPTRPLRARTSSADVSARHQHHE